MVEMTNIIVRILINKRRWMIWKKIWKRQHFFRISINEIYAISVNERMEKMDLKPSQAGVLFSLKHWGEQSQKQLAERVGITPPSMTVALRKMEEKGYVTRRQDEKDQRVVKIHLAPKGEECIEGIQRVICEMEEIVYQGISREEILLMKRLLTEMKNNLLNSKDFKGVDMDTIIEKTCPSARGSF